MNAGQAGNRRRRKSEITIISWRDIPAQLVAESGKQREKLLLPDRFQRAIDRAASVAGLTEASAYVQQWRRRSEPLSGALQSELEALASSIEERYDRAFLEILVSNGGLVVTDPYPENEDRETSHDALEERN